MAINNFTENYDKKFKVLLIIFTLFIFLFGQSLTSLYALSPQQKKIFDSGINYYDTNPGSSDSSSCGVVNGPVSSTLPSDILDRINQLMPEYSQAATETHVPWQLIAGIHYRETSLSTTSSNIFQITGYKGPADFLSQAIAAGNFLQKKSVLANLPEHRDPLQETGNDPEQIKDTMFSYNGRANAYAQQAADLGFDSTTQPYEGSPYVMNNFDTVHTNMKIITHDNGGLDGVDTRFGAYTIYYRLGGSIDTTGSPGSCSPGTDVGNLMQTIMNYAWPDYYDAPYCNEKPSYQQAIESANNAGQYVGGICNIGGRWIGVDCGAFVTRVMIDSGVDPGYNYGGSIKNGAGNTLQQQKYLEEQVTAGKYEKLSNVNGITDLLPGDIAINTVHTYIFVGSQPGFNGNSASASFSTSGQSWRAPMASLAYGFDGEFSWYRLKAGG